MGNRLVEKTRDPRVARDIRVSGDFMRVYCDGHHRERVRRPLDSEGVGAGAYRRAPVLCGECAALQVYAEKRRAFCPYDPKPYCSECETHCYRPEQRALMRDVMRYAGPRSLLTGHPLEGIKHALAMRRHKTRIREAVEQEPTSSEGNTDESRNHHAPDRPNR